ncbi:MAG: hypothetical protein EOM20_20285, partial [Spartobacteria bacterium]|nr:hypothetical protein [Spartobacteria bacterium]
MTIATPFQWAIVGCSLAVSAACAQHTAVIERISVSDPFAVIEWNARTNIRYALETTPHIAEGAPWDNEVMLYTTGTVGSVRDILPTAAAKQFYRIAAPTGKVAAGEGFITYVNSIISGPIAVEVLTPRLPRYAVAGAGIVLVVSGFVGGNNGFSHSTDFSDIGLVHVSCMYPGSTDRVGVASSGVYDYGGPDCIDALRAAARFASGADPDSNGNYLHDLIEIPPIYNNFGLYAASHPGIAAVNLMYFYGSEISNLAWFAGWENPTIDALVSWDAGNLNNAFPVETNSTYVYPAGYSPTNITVRYDLARWATNYMGVDAPYFDLNTNGLPDAGDYIVNPEGSSMFGKRYYSRALTFAISNLGVFAEGEWPADLATAPEAQEVWDYRNATVRYPGLATSAPNLKVILFFRDVDHMQPAIDKPHIHHAYDGFRHVAGAWTRLNPDRAYALWVNGPAALTAPDNLANTEPLDWTNIANWAYTSAQLMPDQAAFASVAELADRTF